MAGEDQPVGGTNRPSDPGNTTLRHVTWPNQGQWARQAGIALVVAALWSVSLWAVVRSDGSGDGVATTVGSAEAEARRLARRSGAEAGGAAAAESGAETGGESMAESATAVATQPAATPTPGTDVIETPPQPARDLGTSPPPIKTDTDPDPALEVVAADPSQGASDDSPGDPLDDARTDMIQMDLGDVEPVSFADEVFPILDKRCVKCHGGPRDEGGLRIEEGLNLLTWEDVMAGSTWGSVVEPGDPVGSYLLELILSGDMPEKEPRLLPREIRIIRNWIATGAPNN